MMCYCPDDDGAREFYNVTYPKGRVERACEECRCRLMPGDRYARHVQKWDGEIAVDCYCLGCEAWSNALAKAQNAACGCSGWQIGTMWNEVKEFAREHLGYDMDTGAKVGDGAIDPKLVGVAMLIDFDERMTRLAVALAEE